MKRGMTTTTVVMNGTAAVEKTVLITGVSRGLGKALALEMAKRGHSVIGCSRSQDKLNSLQSELSDKHLFLNVDVVSYFIHSFIHYYMVINLSLLFLQCSNSSVQEFARLVMEKKGVPDIISNHIFFFFLLLFLCLFGSCFVILVFIIKTIHMGSQ